MIFIFILVVFHPSRKYIFTVHPFHLGRFAERKQIQHCEKDMRKIGWKIRSFVSFFRKHTLERSISVRGMMEIVFFSRFSHPFFSISSTSYFVLCLCCIQLCVPRKYFIYICSELYVDSSANKIEKKHSFSIKSTHIGRYIDQWMLQIKLK